MRGTCGSSDSNANHRFKIYGRHGHICSQRRVPKTDGFKSYLFAGLEMHEQLHLCTCRNRGSTQNLEKHVSNGRSSQRLSSCGVGGVILQSRPFFRKPRISVSGAKRSNSNSSSVKIESELPLSTFIALRLSKEGYGTPFEILRMPTDLILDTLHYTIALAEYEETLIQLNKDKS